jgi:hypothetical protein
MFRLKRDLERGLWLAAVILAVPAISSAQNNSTVQATRTLGAEQNNRPDQPVASAPTSLSPQDAAALKANRDEIRKKAQQLYDLAADLKAEADRTDTDKILSTTLTKKAQEIEKLAKEIKNRTKG